MKKVEEKEIDPVDGLEITKDMFGFSGKDKIESFSDFAYKYLRFFFRLFKNYIPDAKYKIKEFFQRVFRKNHLSGSDVWNLSHELAPKILKRLVAFRDSEKSGFPATFSEWEGDDADHCMGMTRGEYDAAILNGDLDGGGSKEWDRILNEMVFAFDYSVNHDNDFDNQKFFDKWGIKNPYRETEDNLSWGYSYIGPEGYHTSCGDHDIKKDGGIDKLREKGCTNITKHRTYLDMDLITEQNKRVQKGMELFGKYYWNLWD